MCPKRLTPSCSWQDSAEKVLELLQVNWKGFRKNTGTRGYYYPCEETFYPQPSILGLLSFFPRLYPLFLHSSCFFLSFFFILSLLSSCGTKSSCLGAGCKTRDRHWEDSKTGAPSVSGRTQLCLRLQRVGALSQVSPTPGAGQAHPGLQPLTAKALLSALDQGWGLPCLPPSPGPVSSLLPLPPAPRVPPPLIWGFFQPFC